AALRRLREEQLPHIEQLNSLDTQQIPEAETLLVEAGATMGAAERQLGVIINRLAEVETAVAHLPEGLGLAAADLERAIQYRDAEDAKIGPEIDQKLAEADKRLVEARQMAEERQFIAAAAMQTAVRETAVAAYAEAEAQVKQINELQKQLGTARETAVIQTTAADREIASLDALMRMNKTADLAREMGDKLSTARQAANQTLSLEDHALTTALATAVAAFIAAGEIAQQTEKRAQQDRKTYRQQQRETQKAINDAKRAIQTADNKVRHRHARRSGRQSLARARKTLPLMLDGREATRSALIRVKKQAAQAQTYAEDARRKAEQAIERRRREQQTASSGWTFSSGSGFSSSSGSKPRPRPSHSSSGSSHRPRSSGSSRRSSSSGSSRRSSGGRSRRR
ncbi:MAG: hypothetical protein GY803_09255, partial [Chloroflexi bacterium]|nr:hypothetical protein [Chloroflexota bacterium]